MNLIPPSGANPALPTSSPARKYSLSALRAGREGPSAKRWEGEVGAGGRTGNRPGTPTSPQPSPPPGAEREQQTANGSNAGEATHKPRSPAPTQRNRGGNPAVAGVA